MFSELLGRGPGQIMHANGAGLSAGVVRAKLAYFLGVKYWITILVSRPNLTPKFSVEIKVVFEQQHNTNNSNLWGRRALGVD